MQRIHVEAGDDVIHADIAAHLKALPPREIVPAAGVAAHIRIFAGARPLLGAPLLVRAVDVGARKCWCCVSVKIKRLSDRPKVVLRTDHAASLF